MVKEEFCACDWLQYERATKSKSNAKAFVGMCFNFIQQFFLKWAIATIYIYKFITVSIGYHPAPSCLIQVTRADYTVCTGEIILFSGVKPVNKFLKRITVIKRAVYQFQ